MIAEKTPHRENDFSGASGLPERPTVVVGCNELFSEKECQETFLPQRTAGPQKEVSGSQPPVTAPKMAPPRKARFFVIPFAATPNAGDQRQRQAEQRMDSQCHKAANAVCNLKESKGATERNSRASPFGT
jgi:hypothetical protein